MHPTGTWILLSLLFALLVGLLVITGHSHAQSAPPASTCEQQVQEQYKQLAADGLLPQSLVPGDTPLIAITSQVRVLRNQYELKKNQADLAEQQWLQTRERLRLTEQRAKAPVEPSTPASPPTN